ncbi:PKD domain-containing protein [Candidatus Curtissbacteria bacterium]|nr:PKD domain-containing protein [Candidatus Curtissbacteria bacterium]
MRKLLALIFLAPIIFPAFVFAHGAGLPPSFYVNGKFPEANPFQTAGILSGSFITPQDISSEKYLVNTEINFQIDTEKLKPVFAQEVLDKVKFSWDFGDGVKAEGLKNTHIYSKIGSYILNITADFNTQDIPPQLLESVRLNVVPDQNYKLPQAVIKVNGKAAETDPLKATIDVDLSKSVAFDATASVAGNSKIIEYKWDFDDSNNSENKTVNHQYKLPQYYASPSLQIKTADGFVTDTFVTIKNSGNNEASGLDREKIRNILLILLGVIALTTITGVVIYFAKRPKGQSKS